MSPKYEKHVFGHEMWDNPEILDVRVSTLHVTKSTSLCCNDRQDQNDTSPIG